MLPLGRRVQDKLEALIDKYMSKLSKTPVQLQFMEILTRYQMLQSYRYLL